MPKRNVHSPAKTVEWSEADQVFIGRCPKLFAGGVHGDDEVKVFKELCKVADEWMANDKKAARRKPRLDRRGRRGSLATSPSD